MRPIRSLGLRLARIETVRRAIAERADLSPFKARPSFRLLLGVGLIGLSMLMGWPLIGFLGVLAIWSAEPLVAIVGGPAAYGLSWAVYGAGLLIAGREALYYAGVFNRWLVRVLVVWMTGESAGWKGGVIMSSEGKREPGPVVELPSFDPNPSARFAHEILTELEFPYALIGKVAMWAILQPDQHEFTKDVDFAVPLRAIEPIRAALIARGMTPRPLSIGGLGVREGEIRVDFIDRREGGLSALYEEAISEAQSRGSLARVGEAHIQVVSPEYLVALKVVTGEDRDEADAVRLLGALPRMDLARTRDIISRHGGPGSANRLDALARRAGRPDARREYRNSG